ncbi:uncharacterized protein TNCV_1230151 [Trichonephila clavipes]|nr:uncharacterized protein TNCV_1230151 [Trichonephila clavipes]
MVPMTPKRSPKSPKMMSIRLYRQDFAKFSLNLHYNFLVVLEVRKVRSGYLPFRTNASTLPITPKRSSPRDVGTSLYRYHTATYAPASVSVNRRTNNTIFVASIELRHSCDGLVAFAVDRWRHDSGVRTVLFRSRPGSPKKEGRFVLGTFRSERM